MLLMLCSGLLRASMKEIEQNMQVKTTIMSLNPELNIILPNGAMDLSIKQLYYKTLVEYETKYDYLDNYILSELDISYLFTKFSFGLNLYDKVDFEELFANHTTLQRTRRVTPYAGYNITENVKVTLYNKFGNSYTVLLDSNAVVENAKDITPGVELMYSSLDETGALPKGLKTSIDLGKSFSVFGGQYDYTKAEFNLLDYSYPSVESFFETSIKIGYPVSIIKKPIAEIYNLGGYEMLRGYKYKEFKGDYLGYLGFKYRVPLIMKRDFMNMALNIFSLDFQYEMGKVGGKDIFDSTDGLKSSAGIGTGFDLIFFKVINTKFSASFNQALDSHNPEFYFSIHALTYIMK